MTEETYNRLNFEKGYSTSQVLHVIESMNKDLLQYDDVLELVCNIDNPKYPPKEAIHQPFDSTCESQSNFSKGLKEFQASPAFNDDSNPPINIQKQQVNGSDYIECSFSIDNVALNESKEATVKQIDNTRKPPKFISKNVVTAIPKRYEHETPRKSDPHGSSDIRYHYASGSPTEIETARFNKGSNQASSNKEKHQESYRLEISSEISSLLEAGLRGNESLSHEVDSTFNEMNTTAKLMSALGDTPQNLSKLHSYNFGVDKLSFMDPATASFTISEKTPQSNTSKSGLKQLFTNKLFGPGSEMYNFQYNLNNITNQVLLLDQKKSVRQPVNQPAPPVQKDQKSNKQGTNLNLKLPKSTLKQNGSSELSGVNLRKGNESIESNAITKKINKTSNQTQEQVSQEPEKAFNVNDFERLINHMKLNLKESN